MKWFNSSLGCMIMVEFHYTQRMSCTVYYCIENFLMQAPNVFDTLADLSRSFLPFQSGVELYTLLLMQICGGKVCLSVDFREDFDICTRFNFFIHFSVKTLQKTQVFSISFFFSLYICTKSMGQPKRCGSVCVPQLLSECLALKTWTEFLSWIFFPLSLVAAQLGLFLRAFCFKLFQGLVFVLFFFFFIYCYLIVWY